MYLSQDLTFLNPVDIGETMTAVCEVVEALGDDRYHISTTVSNADDTSVIEGEAIVLIDPTVTAELLRTKELDSNRFRDSPSHTDMEIESLAELGPARRRAFFERSSGIDAIRSEVTDLVNQVRDEGDVAVRQLTEKYDDQTVGNLDVTASMEQAYESIDPDLRGAIETAAENIRTFHELQCRDDWEQHIDGRTLGRRFRPIDRVGAYVPGGEAAYPSSALMTVIPARVAGVDQIAVTTPPGDPINPVTLAALHVAGADEVYRVGGAQAIAALAFGTESIPGVQKIVGPGNKWVTAAKSIVQGEVDIDFLAGPSEILVIADESASPACVAADMIAQAEHDPHAPCVSLCTSESLCQEILDELAHQLAKTDRRDIVEEALDHDSSGIIHVRSLSEAISFAQEFAAEHLSIQTRDPRSISERVTNAGSIFLGSMTPVAAGDYASGTNHVLPTHGLAKRTGGLCVDEFVRTTTIQELSREGLDTLAPTITALAEAEGLTAHADSVRIRIKDDSE